MFRVDKSNLDYSQLMEEDASKTYIEFVTQSSKYNNSQFEFSMQAQQPKQ